MRIVSITALAAVLAIGTATLTLATDPASAQDKKGAAAPAPQISAEFRTAALAAETALKARDFAGADAQLKIAEPLAISDDEKYFFHALRVPTAANLKQNDPLNASLDALIANPKTPADQLPRFTFLRGNQAFAAKDFARVPPLLTRARELGYRDDNLELMLAQSYFEQRNVPAGLAEIDRAIKAKEAAGQKAPSSWYEIGVARTATGADRVLADQWLRRWLAAYPTTTNWHKTVSYYRDGPTAKFDTLQRIDLFRLQRAANALVARSDYLDYAQATSTRGLFDETRTVLNAGFDSGRLPKTDPDAKKLLTEAEARIRAEGSLAAGETRARAAANGVSAAGVGNAYLGQGNYAKAIEMHEVALQKGGVDAAEVTTRLGIAQALAGQKDAARATFAKVTTAPRAGIAQMWTTWLDVGSTAAPAAAPAAAAPTTAPAATN